MANLTSSADCVALTLVGSEWVRRMWPLGYSKAKSDDSPRW